MVLPIPLHCWGGTAQGMVPYTTQGIVLETALHSLYFHPLHSSDFRILIQALKKPFFSTVQYNVSLQ